MLPEAARYDTLLNLPSGASLGGALVAAMNAIEADFAPLQGSLPKDYDRFDNKLLENLLRCFDSQALRNATGDVFGRIYEYFLMKFAMQGAQDKGRIFHAAFAGANAGQHHRARPRRVGGVIRPQFGSRHVCCRGLKKNTAQPTTLLASSNLWMTRGK